MCVPRIFNGARFSVASVKLDVRQVTILSRFIVSVLLFVFEISVRNGDQLQFARKLLSSVGSMAL